MNLIRGTPLQTQLNDLLNDLEVTYLDLVGGQLWSGVIATPHQSSFLAGNVDDNAKFKDTQAMAVKINLPWDKWVKLYAKCHHCRDKGHIHRQFPDYIKKVRLGEIKRSNGSNRTSPCSPPSACSSNRSTPLHCNNFLKDPKAKAFLSAFQALFADNKVNEKDNKNKNHDIKDDDKPDDDTNNDLHNF
jgi:hypothetical protein